MSPAPDVVVEPDADRLAAAVAGALVDRLAAAQAARGTASVVLTGGGIGIAVLEQVAAQTGDRVDWTAVDVWWGDERFVPDGDDERNEKAARDALLDVVGVPESRVHAMPPSDGAFAEPEGAADWYAGELAAAAAPGREVPRFDVLLLGIGPEGHTASIFPDSPAAHDQRAVFAVHDCPKPPPTRVSLGFSAINTADEVWLVVAGEDKAPAVARAVAGADRVELPAAGVHGTQVTRWWLDPGAAGRLPRS